MGLLVVNSDFERLWNEPYPTISFDNATYSLAGEVGTTLSASFAIFDNYDADVTDQCEITLDNDNVSIEDGMFVCDDLEVGTYQTIATATYSYKSATVTATATINISVEEEKPTSISFDSNSYSLSGTEGETITESFTVTDNLSNDVTALCSYAFSPNDTGITASNGTFDASSVLAGTYSVTVTATYGELTTTATISMDIQSAESYLTFEALESGTFTFGEAVDYSVDGGTTWTTLAASTASPTVAQGDKILWKAQINCRNKNFASTGRFNAEGNIMSLMYGDNFVNQTTFPSGYDFYHGGFYQNTKLVSAENLVLPVTTLTANCYESMFYGCTSLTAAPTLPATTLATGCYSIMFYGCTSLTTAPELPATTLATSCYKNMFNNCTSLTTAPTTLPATTLSNECYQNMFKGCSSLRTAPVLPATTLADNCYREMFNGCTNLNSITMLATNISATSCLFIWVQGVQTTSGTFTKSASMTTLPSGASGIPENWTVVDA